MNPHQPTIDAISKCAAKHPGKLLSKHLAVEMDLYHSHAILMCERNGIEPFQICGSGPLKKLDTAEPNASDNEQHSLLIQQLLSRVHELESKSNHRTQ